jgi:hypothetical protein
MKDALQRQVLGAIDIAAPDDPRYVALLRLGYPLDRYASMSIPCQANDLQLSRCLIHPRVGTYAEFQREMWPTVGFAHGNEFCTK